MYTFLQRAGYLLIFKPTLEQEGVVKGNCDAELVLHTMLEFNHFEKALIVTNDGDFFCLVEYLAARKKLLKLITPSFNYSSLLRKYARYIVPIPLFKQKVQKARSRRKAETKNRRRKTDRRSKQTTQTFKNQKGRQLAQKRKSRPSRKSRRH